MEVSISTIFTILSIIKIVIAGSTLGDLETDANKYISKLDEINAGSTSKLIKEIDSTKQSCSEFEEVYLFKGEKMMAYILENVLEHHNSQELPEADWIAKKQRVEETVELRQLEYTKCITHLVPKAINLINDEYENVKIITDFIKAVKRQPKKCLEQDEPRLCFLPLISNLKQYLNGLPDKVTQITDTVQKIVDHFMKDCERCHSDLLGNSIQHMPELLLHLSKK